MSCQNYTLPWKQTETKKYDSVYVETIDNSKNKLTITTVYRPAKQQAADDAAISKEFTP